jgi:hypothetical protein
MSDAQVPFTPNITTISFEEMPEENKQKALDIFGRQMRGEITQAEAETEARANENEAFDKVYAGVFSPSEGEPSDTTRQPPFSNRPGQPGAAGDEAICGPRPGTPLEPGQVLVCNRQTRRWEVQRDPAAAYRPPAELRDPMTDPTRVPDGAPEGYTYEWNGTRWVLKRDEDAASQFALQQARESAMDVIGRRLEAYGLGSLANFVWDIITKENITSEYALIERIRETDQYKQRFPAMKMRRDRNLTAISEQAYIDLENSYRETMKIAGMPRGLFDGPEDFTSLISGDVSPKELQQRVQAGYQAVAQSNPQVINEMKRLYGVNDSMLAAYFLDPEKATPMLLRQAQSAQIAAEATLQAEMGITAGTAEELAVAGVTQEQARAGFQAIQAGQELFVPLPGTTEAAIAQEEQIAGVFGTSSAAQQRIRQRTRERQATFEAGGRFAGQGTTVTGLQ